MSKIITIEEFMALKLHPEANRAPIDIKSESFKALMEDIKTNSLQVPVMLYEGYLLKGRRRRKAIEILQTRGDLPSDFQVRFREYQPNVYYNAADIKNSLTYLKRNYTDWEIALMGVADFYEDYSKEAEMRMKNGKEAMPESKGKTSVKIAKKVGVSRHKADVAIGLLKFDERLIDIGLLGQLDEDSARKYNSLTNSEKMVYLNWFLDNPYSHRNFAVAKEELEQKESGDEGDHIKKDVGSEDCKNPDAHEAIEDIDNYPIFAVFTQPVCQQFIDKVADAAREYGYLRETSIMATLDNKVKTILEVPKFLDKVKNFFRHIVKPKQA